MPDIVDQSVRLEFITPNAMKFIERSGRISYKSEDRITSESAKPFVLMLIERGHESVLEHVGASIIVITNRAVANEIVRHRLNALTQESTRFCNYLKAKFGGTIRVIVPFEATEEQYVEWLLAMEDAERHYMNLIKLGWKPEYARGVLPLDTKTELMWTANFRQWRTILNQRLDPKAHPQMRVIMWQIADLLMKDNAPVFEDIVKKYPRIEIQRSFVYV